MLSAILCVFRLNWMEKQSLHLPGISRASATNLTKWASAGARKWQMWRKRQVGTSPETSTTTGIYRKKNRCFLVGGTGFFAVKRILTAGVASWLA